MACCICFADQSVYIVKLNWRTAYISSVLVFTLLSCAGLLITMDTNVKVAIRCRPLIHSELTKSYTSIVELNEDKVFVKMVDIEENTEFPFDKCYGANLSNLMIYNELIEPLLTFAMNGFNVTIVTCGQTAAGKSHTIQGTFGDDTGLLHLACSDLFSKIARNSACASSENLIENNLSNTTTEVKVSCLEVYNEVITDLLNPSSGDLTIKETEQQGLYVKDLVELIVHSPEDIRQQIATAERLRMIRVTNMGMSSSRAHSVFTIHMEQKQVCDGTETILMSEMKFVELAGSERQKTHTTTSGATLTESKNINKSLSSLATVIDRLFEKATNSTDKPHFIPYRDSKLTRLLQTSLGGNCLTQFIGCISPADFYVQETFNTIQFMNKVKRVVNRGVRRNEVVVKRVLNDSSSDVVIDGCGCGVEQKVADVETQQLLQQQIDV